MKRFGAGFKRGVSVFLAFLLVFSSVAVWWVLGDDGVGGTYDYGYYQRGSEYRLDYFDGVGGYARAEDWAGFVAADGFRTEPMIVAGWMHTMALRDDGTVWGWGLNGRGQLGDSTTVRRTSPVQVQDINNMTAVAAGGEHSIALMGDGTVWAWGDNRNGQLGDNTTSSRTAPVQVLGINGIVAVAAGGHHSVALRNDGTVWTWGGNASGQLGNNSTARSTVPVQVQNLSNVVAVAAGGTHTLALCGDGFVWTWGSNSWGQLGDDSTSMRTTPVQVHGLHNVVTIAAEWQHSIALKDDGTVWNWGRNTWGQLGDNTTTQSSTPVRAQNLNNMIAVGTGAYHSMAVRNDGTVWTWGRNAWGQLGDGSTTHSYLPKQVQAINNVIAVAPRGEHSVALRDDGSVWTWGSNRNNQLGDNTTTNRHYPVQVRGEGGVGYFNVFVSATSSPPQNDMRNELLGEWVGTYTLGSGFVNHGVNGLRLTVYMDGANYRAIVNFFPVHGSAPAARTGSYHADVRINQATGAFEIVGTTWIDRPSATWHFVDFSGSIAGYTFSGGASGNWVDFSVSRVTDGYSPPLLLIDDITGLLYGEAAITGRFASFNMNLNVNDIVWEVCTPGAVTFGTMNTFALPFAGQDYRLTMPITLNKLGDFTITASINNVTATSTVTANVINISAVANRPSLVIGVGESVILGYEKDINGVTVADWDNAVVTVSRPSIVSITNRSFELWMINHRFNGSTITGLAVGTAEITIRDPDSGVELILHISVENITREPRTYRILEPRAFYPTFYLDRNVSTYFHNVNGLFVRNWRVTSRGGREYISFDVYNQLYIHGAVDVFDRDGNWYSTHRIEKFSEITSLRGALYGAFNIFVDLGRGNSFNYRSTTLSRLTEIRYVHIPEGGHFTISNNVKESPGALLYNSVDLLITLASSALDVTLGSGNRQEVKDEIIQSALTSEDFLKTFRKMAMKIGEGIARNATNNFNGDVAGSLVDSTIMLLDSVEIDWRDIVVKFAGGSAWQLSTVALDPFGGMRTIFAINRFTSTFLQSNQLVNSVNVPFITIIGSERSHFTTHGGVSAVLSDDDVAGDALFRAFRIVSQEMISFGGSAPTSQYAMYDISFVVDGNVRVQPHGEVTIMLPIPYGFNPAIIRVYHEILPGTWQRMDTRIDGDYIVFETDRFSRFAIVDLDGTSSANGTTLTATFTLPNPTHPITAQLHRDSATGPVVSTATIQVTPTNTTTPATFTINAPPGTYTLTFSQPGHTSFTINNIVIPTTGGTINLSQDPRFPQQLPLHPGDINGDGQVNIQDLSILLQHWMGSYANANIAGGGQVNIEDLSLLLQNWMAEAVVVD